MSILWLDKNDFTNFLGYYMPLIFGFIIGLFNSKFYKWKVYFYRPLQVIITSILISYLSFLFTMYSFPLLAPVLEDLVILLKITNNKNNITLEILINYWVFAVAPIVVFFVYKIIFYYPKKMLTVIILLITLLIFGMMGYFSYHNFGKISYVIHLLWQPLMALALQLILYQEEVKDLFRKKSPTKS